MKALRSYLPIWRPTNAAPNQMQYRKIEEYKPGYPRFTALISAHDGFFLCRRFNKLRARILLLKQDKLSMLEQKLEQLDQQEISFLFLGKSRCDQNADRISLLSEIESCLTDYDQFAESTHRMLSLGSAQRRDVKSLRNWLDGTGCLAREETAYLAHSIELASLAPGTDTAVTQLEAWIEDQFIRFYQGFRKWSHLQDVSSDAHVYIYSGPLLRRIAQVLLLILITIILLLPVIICNIVNTTSVRIVIVMLSTIIFLFTLSALTKSRTMELILAAATYATVLIVFVSGSSRIQS